MLVFRSNLGIVVLLLSGTIAAQTQVIAPNTLPDAPSSVRRARVAPAHRKELFARDPYRPLKNSDKRDYWFAQTYAASTFASVGFDTAYAAATGDFRFCCGAQAWAQQYAAVLADKETRMLFGRFIFPVLLDQDPRYFPKGEGSVISRAWYAASRVLITRNDEGHPTLNTSEVLSVAFSRGLSNAYYPERDRTLARTASRIYGTLQSDAVGNLLTEFSPDIKRIFKRHAPKRFTSLAENMRISRSQAEEDQP